jgi:hypothetical protein
MLPKGSDDEGLSSQSLGLDAFEEFQLSIFYTTAQTIMDSAIENGSCSSTEPPSICLSSDVVSDNPCLTPALVGIVSKSSSYASKVPPGTNVLAWLKDLSVLLVFETPLVNLLSTFDGKSAIVVNADWLDLSNMTKLDPARTTFIAKGPGTFANLTSRAQLKRFSMAVVPWSIPDPVIASRRPPSGTGLQAVMLFGMGFDVVIGDGLTHKGRAVAKRGGYCRERVSRGLGLIAGYSPQNLDQYLSVGY